MRLLQLHEYLQLLNAGVTGITLDGSATDGCLRSAAAAWPQTGLSAWHAVDRRVEYACRTGQGHVLCHVTADHRDCFMIVVLDGSSQRADAYIVFDIGSQYRQPIFICPASGFKGPATAEEMAAAIQNLISSKDAFAILDLMSGTYMQTLQEEPDRYVLEHQLVTIKYHYQVPRRVDAPTVVAAFQSYALGKYEWSTDLPWERIDL